MATKTMYSRVANLSFAKAIWDADYSDRILLKGEIGFETDTRKMKVGDGTTTWANLSYVNPDYTLPIATDTVLGGIKSSTGVGAVTVNSSTGVASVASVAEAGKLSTARTIAVSGDVAGSADFDGSANITIAVTASDATESAHGFMSAADKTKLNGISTGANKVEASVTNGNIKIDGNETTVYTLPVAGADTVGGIKSGDILTVSAAGAPSFADVVASTSGAGGSHGLMTAAQAEKLAGIATGAQVNVLEGVSFKGSRATEFSDLTIVNKKAQLDLSNYPTFDDLGSALNFRGDKTGDQLAALTVSDVKNGDVYQCTADDSGSPVTFHANMEYAAVISGDPATLSWVELGNWVDLSGYVQKTQTINSKALSGNIVLDGSDIALSSSYTEAATAAKPAAGDTLDVAVGKVQKEIDVLNGDSSTAGSVAKSIKDAVEALDYTDSVSGDYVTSVSEADGIISVTKGTKGSVASGATALVDGGTVYSAIDGAVTVDTITVNGTAATLTNKTLPFAEGSTNGTVKVAGTDVAVHGLGSNAFDSTARVPETATVNGISFATASDAIVLDGADIALTGYTKASSAAAVEATDTINQAIGKLEYKVDNATTGTVTSVGLSMPSIFSVSGSPVTSSGTLTAELDTQSANTVFAGPSTGSAAEPSFRALVADDIPTLAASKVQLAGATANNVASIDASGSYKDSGVAVANLIDKSVDFVTIQCAFEMPSNS